MSNWAQGQSDESSNVIAQLNNIIEEQARRRFQQQYAQHHFSQYHHQHSANSPSEISGEPSFTYHFSDNVEASNNALPFAVNPSDPRYYEPNTRSSVGAISYEDDYQEIDDSRSKQQSDGIQDSKTFDQVTYYKLKPPMPINPKIPIPNNDVRNSVRNDLKALVEKLQRDSQTNAIINGEILHDKSDVVKKQMSLDGTVGMYIVALIAGISAAVTVGFIALGIGWYTLHKKAKAAADVEYPAYGVTGPNKDISPSGDRRLAQSAQMYHYQHQKQQIIAMENSTGGERHGGISDVESDDDNEEGDYTVYECPGLAPTGEMEVKNPLFLDETPVTPVTSTNDGQLQAQPQKQILKTPKKNTGNKAPANDPSLQNDSQLKSA